MAVETLDKPRRESGLIRTLKSIALLRESTVGMVGASLVLFWILVAILADLISPYDPNATLKPNQTPMAVYLTPQIPTMLQDAVKQTADEQSTSKYCQKITQGETAGQWNCGTFWLGTDTLGRDILSRIIHGSRQVLLIAPLATFCAYLVGIPMGLAAGYRRGWVDDVLSFVGNVILSFPVLVLYVIVIATIGASAFNIVVAVTFASAPGIMRIVRGLVLDLRNREYVFAAETRGESPWRIMLIEILPNARGPLIVDSCLRLGYVIITIGVLGFLGLGLPPPDPDWGGMINETRRMAIIFPHMSLFPCFAISSLVLGFNLVADGLREVALRD